MGMLATVTVQNKLKGSGVFIVATDINVGSMLPYFTFLVFVSSANFQYFLPKR